MTRDQWNVFMASAKTPSYLRDSYGTLINGCQNIADWSGVAGTTEYDATHFRYGVKGIKLTSGVSSSGIMDLLNVSFGNPQNIGLWIYIHDITKLSYFRVYVSSVSNFSKYFLKQYNSVAGLINGWNWIVLAESDFTNTGADTWAAIANIRVRMAPLAGQQSVVTYCGIWANPNMRPKFAFSFDDSSITIYNKAFPTFQSRGIKGTFYVVSNDILGSSGTGNIASVSQVQEMYAAGWGIGNHTMDHVNLTTVSDAEVLNQVRGCTEQLLQWGFYRSAYQMGIPYGAYNDNVLELMAQCGIKMARSSDLASMQVNQPYNILRMSAVSELNLTSVLATLQAKVDYVIANKGIGIFYGHIIADIPVGAYDVATSILTGLLDYIIAAGGEIITMSQLYAEMYS